MGFGLGGVLIRDRRAGGGGMGVPRYPGRELTAGTEMRTDSSASVTVFTHFSCYDLLMNVIVWGGLSYSLP